ncbi:MAG: hypothetical protein WCY37_04265 [Candidatus Dojkabacteria bacterium]
MKYVPVLALILLSTIGCLLFYFNMPFTLFPPWATVIIILSVLALHFSIVFYLSMISDIMAGRDCSIREALAYLKKKKKKKTNTYTYSVEYYNLTCPTCGHEVIKGHGTKVYETLYDHVCRPNAENLPAREYYVCSNPDCEVSQHTIFDSYGTPYNNGGGGDWYLKHRIEPRDPKTHKKTGVFPVGSQEWKNMRAEVKKNAGLSGRIRRWLSGVSNKKHNLSCELRRRFCPTAIWRDNTKWYRKTGYSLGIWLMDPFGTGWKKHTRYLFEDSVLEQWAHHPYPWVSWRVRKTLAIPRELRERA